MGIPRTHANTHPHAFSLSLSLSLSLALSGFPLSRSLGDAAFSASIIFNRYVKPGGDMKAGDSGGPWVVERPHGSRRYYLVGVRQLRHRFGGISRSSMTPPSHTHTHTLSTHAHRVGALGRAHLCRMLIDA